MVSVITGILYTWIFYVSGTQFITSISEDDASTECKNRYEQPIQNSMSEFDSYSRNQFLNSIQKNSEQMSNIIFETNDRNKYRTY